MSPAAQRAAEAVGVLVGAFWDNRRRLFSISSSRRLLPWGSWHFWWQAHALHVLVDAGDLDRADRLVAGVLRRNHGITNAYYDDMAWMGIALQRAAAAGLPTARLVERLLAALHEGVEPAHGVVRWRRGDPYVNVPANAPAAILSARCGDGAFGGHLLDWLQATLVDPTSGAVHDGLNVDGRLNRDPYTYNFGTVVGAAVALGRLDMAAPVAAAVMSRMAPGGVLRDEGPGDGALFKGICVHYLAQYAVASGDGEVRAFVLRNAEAAWSVRSPAGLNGTSWTSVPAGPVDLSAHLSGVLVQQAAAAVTP